MKKRYCFLIVLIFAQLILYSQEAKKSPEFSLSQAEVESHIRMLASDEILGRKTGEQTNNIAARYIAEQFRMSGAKPVEGQKDFLQKVELEFSKAKKLGYIKDGQDSLIWSKDFIMISGKAVNLKDVATVFVGYGWKDDTHDDYKGIDVKDKIVICQFGIPDNDQPYQNILGSIKKTKFAAENGALAIIQVYNQSYPFTSIERNFASSKLGLATNNTADLPHIWVNGIHSKKFISENLKKLSLDVSEVSKKPVSAYNVVGLIEGTDPKLKNEYVVLSAHFDHIGTGASAGRISETDSIFNGTRDNAIGTSALIMASKALNMQKPKRSILLIAYTGEELGMLGSKFYSENPLIPLKNCVFNLNSDGAGYNDSTKITIIGLNRTTAENELKDACKAFGIEASNDPVPEQNLFDRSDNVSLAAKGIPAPNFSPGLTAFDAEISKYYHQVGDNPENLSYSYVNSFCKAFIYSARLIANKKETPKWIKGDKYEKAAEALYK
jgi:hypothetical protein